MIYISCCYNSVIKQALQKLSHYTRKIEIEEFLIHICFLYDLNVESFISSKHVLEYGENVVDLSTFSLLARRLHLQWNLRNEC